MRVRIVSLVGAVYGLGLTSLLLMSDPHAVLIATPLEMVYRALEPVIHAVWFAGMGCLAVCGRWPLRRRNLAVSLALFAILSELLQSFVPGRTCEWQDLMQNIFGLVGGAALGTMLRSLNLASWWQRAREHAMRGALDLSVRPLALSAQHDRP